MIGCKSVTFPEPLPPPGPRGAMAYILLYLYTVLTKWCAKMTQMLTFVNEPQFSIDAMPVRRTLFSKSSTFGTLAPLQKKCRESSLFVDRGKRHHFVRSVSLKISTTLEVWKIERWHFRYHFSCFVLVSVKSNLPRNTSSYEASNSVCSNFPKFSSATLFSWLRITNSTHALLDLGNASIAITKKGIV